MKATDHIKRAAFEKAVDYFLADPEHNIVKIMDLIDKVAPKDLFASQRAAFRSAIDDQSNWYRLIMHIMNDTNPEVRDDLVKTLIIDGNLMAWPVQEANRDKYECNIPWAILLDPTSACNLHCTGCWAAEVGNKLNLQLGRDRFHYQAGKELGTHVYIYTGGEPLVRKKDLIKLCEMHPDCVFLSFTNGTLIDEAFCQEMIRVKNFVPAISAEGFEEATDSRRGEGTYAKVQKAMQLLKRNGLPFGVSCCYTSQNAESIASEEYFDYLIDQGALVRVDFLVHASGRWVHGRSYGQPRATRTSVSLRPRNAPEEAPVHARLPERRRICRRLHCPAGVVICTLMRRVMSTLAFSRTTPMPTSVRSPCSRLCSRPSSWSTTGEQPFSDNLLRPCPILENSGKLTEMVERAGAHSSDLQEQETAEELCAKTKMPLRHGSRFRNAFGMTRTTRCSRSAMMLPRGWLQPT